MIDLIVIGGGAAGFFAAIQASSKNKKVVLLEKTLKPLSKVRISGGGRCNVTHACFDPKKLTSYYPRGEKELLGPFNQFQPKDTMEWFQSRGVPLKIEEDGRVFPTSDNSETIIDCLCRSAKNVEIRLGVSVEKIEKEEGLWKVKMSGGEELFSTSLLLATGSAPQGHLLAQSFGHKIDKPVPSLFTFNVPTSPLLELSGISVPSVTLKIRGTSLSQTGILLLTHFGFSGPAALRLSAWGAKELFECQYHAILEVDWTGGISYNDLKNKILTLKKEKGSAPFSLEGLIDGPKSLIKKLGSLLDFHTKRFSEISLKEVEKIIELLQKSAYQIEGKTTHKQEFVTCGGINLKEVNFKTMESKLVPGLFFAGEILNIDGITGGFNFQNAWTTGWLAGSSLP